MRAVSDAIREIAALKDDARRVRDKITEGVNRTKVAITNTENGLVDPLLAAVSELESINSGITNGAPVETSGTFWKK